MDWVWDFAVIPSGGSKRPLSAGADVQAFALPARPKDRVWSNCRLSGFEEAVGHCCHSAHTLVLAEAASKARIRGALILHDVHRPDIVWLDRQRMTLAKLRLHSALGRFIAQL